MKLFTLSILSFFIFSNLFAQGTNKLIAHWDFNGSANDISGNALNGTVTGTTMTAGYGGVANTAYEFNGTSDHIDVAYNSLMNLDSFSICALIKPLGYYSGTCQVNAVFARANEWTSYDGYRLMFSDNAYDDDDCSNYSPGNEVFMPSAHGTEIPSDTTWYAGNTLIDTGVWYCVVVTYDRDSMRLFIDGAEVKAAQFIDSYTPGSAPISIAYQLADATNGYPYFYKGLIDDIKLYGRVLSLEEAGQYCDSAKRADSVYYDNSGNHSSEVSNAQMTPTIVIAPNPTHDNILIQLSGNNNNGYVQLVNSVGQLISEKQIDGSQMGMNLENLPAGLYMVRVNVNNQLIVKKIIKE